MFHEYFTPFQRVRVSLILRMESSIYTTSWGREKGEYFLCANESIIDFLCALYTSYTKQPET